MALFARVVGHTRQRELLARALAGGGVHTDYLFCGPPGVGKGLVARELARAWLCLAGRGEPCGRCAACLRPETNPDADLLLVGPLEGKKSISVVQVRALESWLALSPSRGARKVAIVDPAEALTEEAANALLKTLEEPPEGRILILVTTRAGELPATVRSRCQLVSFGPLALEEVAEVLRRNGYPAQSARQVAATAEGSPGSVIDRDRGSWTEAAGGVQELLEALGRGERGAALAYAERLGESRERVLLALQALLGLLREAARERLDAGAGQRAPEYLRQLGTEELAELLAGALEAHRRLEGDRPPNAKLAVATLLLGAGAGRRGESVGPAGGATAAARGGRR